MIVLLNKPFGVLCQFTGEGKNLSDYIDIKGIYPAGRLDKDSEGLVMLTDDGKLQHQISSPKFNKEKIYLLQVEGDITEDAVSQLCQGVKLKDGLTKPAKAKIINHPDWLWSRKPSIRTRKNIPTSWLELSITEGKNRQIRRMSAYVGFPVLRLVRTCIGKHSLNNLKSGDYECL